MAAPEARSFPAGVPSVRGEEPLLLGLVGPPGGGKTVSALRLATGMKQIRGGPVVLIDTEGGRSRKYSPEPGKPADPARLQFDFLRVDMTPPFRSHDFLAAIKAQLPLKPSAIIVDTMSSEHEDEGGYLEWHDELVPKFGGNEWAAWSAPKAGRKRLISGLLQIKVPLLINFRAREKTVTEPGKGRNGKDNITNIGWMPVAPLEIVHALDLTCILPPRADGVPVWTSEKVGEDFIVKLPAFLAPLVQSGQLSEATGAALARWAMGTPTQAPQKPSSGQPVAKEEDAPRTPDYPERLKAIDGARQQLARIATREDRADAITRHWTGANGWRAVTELSTETIREGTASLARELDGLAAMKVPEQWLPSASDQEDQQPAEREPGEEG